METVSYTHLLWHSGVLQIIEPSEYHGIYHLELPQGVTALCDNLSYVYGNEEYELVSDHEPAAEETFGIRAEFIWLKAVSYTHLIQRKRAETIYSSALPG